MKYSSESFYNLFSFFYPLVDIFLKGQKKELLKNINNLQEGKLLEIGVGNGTHLPLYKKHNIVAIDTSSEMLERAKKYKSETIELFEMSGESLTFENESFDYVVLSHVISVVPNVEKLMHEVQRVLKKEGKIYILNHFTPNNFLKYIDHAFNPISKFFHFKSSFHIEDIKAMQKFELKDEISFGKFSYYKLLIYSKK